MEVHQQSDLDPRQFHLGQQGCRLNAQSLLNSLQLDKELVLHQDVQAGSTVEEHVLVSTKLCKLQLKRQYGGDSIHLPSMVCGLSSIAPDAGVDGLP